MRRYLLIGSRGRLLPSCALGATSDCLLRTAIAVGESPIVEAVSRNDASINSIRTRSIRTTTESELIYLKKHDILALCEEYPELNVKLRSFALSMTKLSKKGKRHEEMNVLRTTLSPRHQGVVPHEGTVLTEDRSGRSNGRRPDGSSSLPKLRPPDESMFSFCTDSAGALDQPAVAATRSLDVLESRGSQATMEAVLARLDQCVAQNETLLNRIAAHERKLATMVGV